MAKQLVALNEVFVIDGAVCKFSACSFLAVYIEEYWGIGLDKIRVELKRIHHISDHTIEIYRAKGFKVIPANKIG